MKYKKGDVVKVYSLQSFFGGGFINGTEGIVSQDQNSGSVLVAVKRKRDGEDEIDPTYEVYPEQLRMVKKATKKTLIEDFEKLIAVLKE